MGGREVGSVGGRDTHIVHHIPRSSRKTRRRIGRLVSRKKSRKWRRLVGCNDREVGKMRVARVVCGPRRGKRIEGAARGKGVGRAGRKAGGGRGGPHDGLMERAGSDEGKVHLDRAAGGGRVREESVIARESQTDCRMPRLPLRSSLPSSPRSLPLSP